MVRIVTAPAVNIITAMTEYIGILWSPVSGVELRATSESSISVEDLEVSFFLLVSVIRLPAGALSSSMVVVSTAGGVTEEVADGIGVVVADMEGEGDGVMPGVTVGVVVAGTTVGVTVGVAVAGTTDGVIVGATVGVAVAGTVVGVAVGVDVGVTVGDRHLASGYLTVIMVKCPSAWLKVCVPDKLPSTLPPKIVVKA